MNLSKEDLKKETGYLNDTIKLLRANISSLAQDLYDNEDKQKEFKQYMWDSKQDLDPTEMKTLMTNNDLEIVELERKADYYKKLYRIQNSPYFGKVTFDTKDEGINDIYIGLTYLDKGLEHVIYDWRAPISSIFYDFESGPAYYDAPGGRFEGIIHNKRQFTIEDGKIKRVFDNNLNVQDELLQEVLSNKASEKMKNIVNTIQAEQNAIIRNVKDKNLIVQGIAGSGKTSVALHRIAFLLYKIKYLTSDKILIFAPNSVFSEYISNVLPELGEDNTKETTFHEFFRTYITEYKDIESFTSFIERYYKHKELDTKFVKFKQSNDIIKPLTDYINDFVDTLRFTDDLFNHDVFFEKIKLNYMLKERYSSIPLMRRIEEMSQKISDMECRGSKSKTRMIRSKIVPLLNKSIDYKEIYKNFFRSNYFKEAYGKEFNDYYIDRLNEKNMYYEDAPLFVYMKCLLEGFPYDYEIEETVIDEAQDYSILEYTILRKILRKSNFTILGDINQTINPYYHYNSLEELTNILDNSKYLELTKTYRSSPEIIEHTNKILGLKLVSAIRRDNNIPVEFKHEGNLKDQLKYDIEKLQKNNASIAIITKTNDEAIKVYNLLYKDFDSLKLISNNSSIFSKGLVVIPSYMAKGLEFDATIIYTDKDNYYTKDERYLYYVSCTRSQHHLIIYNQKNEV